MRKGERKKEREMVEGMEMRRRRRRVLEALLKRTNRSPLSLLSVSLSLAEFLPLPLWPLPLSFSLCIFPFSLVLFLPLSFPSHSLCVFLSLFPSLSPVLLSFHPLLSFSLSPFVCLSLQLGNCPGYFRIHRNATTADMHRRGGKGAQWVIFHTLFAKMWRSIPLKG